MKRLFEFQCRHCGQYVEKLAASDKDYPQCPEGHGVMEKLISASTFHFKDGSGTNMGQAYAFRGRPLWGG